jgi:hypothetical protein
MSAELMLEATNVSLLIIEKRTHKDIVVGVPHHAPAGTLTLPCCEHPNADENVGFLGRYLAETLGCYNVIACNYTFDVNKYFRSDYSMQIAAWGPKVLVEIHGHAVKKKTPDNLIEISSGSRANDRFSKVLADKLQLEINSNDNLKSLTLNVKGEYDNLQLPASESVTISDGRWVPYHIELPPCLRIPTKEPKTGKPPEEGYLFCDILARTLTEIHRNKNSQQPA